MQSQIDTAIEYSRSHTSIAKVKCMTSAEYDAAKAILREVASDWTEVSTDDGLLLDAWGPDSDTIPGGMEWRVEVVIAC